jgi:excisionase family DNA binding protein
MNTQPETVSRRLFDIPSAVQYLRDIGAASATTSFVRGLIATGGVPHVRIGKRFYVSKTALDTWLAQHEKRAR